MLLFPAESTKMQSVQRSSCLQGVRATRLGPAHGLPARIRRTACRGVRQGVREHFAQPPATPVPSEDQLRELEQRFRDWMQLHERLYSPGTDEYHLRYLNWLTGYKQYYHRVRRQLGGDEAWLAYYVGTEFADYGQGELQALYRFATQVGEEDVNGELPPTQRG